MPKKIRAGLIGAGFVGPLHVEAARRLGYVEFIAVASSTKESASRKADRLTIDRAYAGYEELLADDDVQVVHVCTPNYLHRPVVKAAIRAGKHVICDKPLAMTAAEAKELRDDAQSRGVVNAVTFNYRFNPLVQQARSTVAKGGIGTVRFVHGYYLQDHLLYETDFSWRLEPEKAGLSCAVGDIGSHWCDTAQFITGLRIVRVLASLSTTIAKRKKPGRSREAFAAGGASERVEDYDCTLDDLGSVLVEFENGARGAFSVGQVCPGHKNDLRVEVNGEKGSIGWIQEDAHKVWIGHRGDASGTLQLDPALLDESVRRYSNLPGGHNEAWADAFKNMMRNIYEFVSADGVSDKAPVEFPTFEDGYRVNCIVDAIVKSSREGSGWTAVEY